MMVSLRMTCHRGCIGTFSNKWNRYGAMTSISLASSSMSTLASSQPQKSQQGKKKGFLSRLYEEYSIQGQQKRIKHAEQLFRFAQMRADDPRWYGPGRIGREFRPRHAMLTMHVWFLNKRLLVDATQNTNGTTTTDATTNRTSLLVQEELFDIFWDDTQKRIREQGVPELTVNKHLTDVQQYTFQHLTHYDHAFTEFKDNPKGRLEELCGIFWIHMLQRDSNAYLSNQVQRMALYMDMQYTNIVHTIPEHYWNEGRLKWVDIPDFSNMKDNKGQILPDVPLHPEDVLPPGWYKALTTAGEVYYWNPSQTKSQWERPLPIP